jgi:uncharacterized protein YacL
MEILVRIVSLGLLIGLILSPILILVKLNRLNIRYKFVAFLTLTLIVTSILTFLFAWWVDTSSEVLLSHYGYDSDGLSDAERFQDVSAENNERVKQLETDRMGIGWPLKAFMTYMVYSPYLLVVYLIGYLIGKYRH